jgi:hypothetical protein
VKVSRTYFGSADNRAGRVDHSLHVVPSFANVGWIDLILQEGGFQRPRKHKYNAALSNVCNASVSLAVRIVVVARASGVQGKVSFLVHVIVPRPKWKWSSVTGDSRGISPLERSQEKFIGTYNKESHGTKSQVRGL